MHAERDASGRFIPPLMSAWQPGDCTANELVQQHHKRGVEKVIVLDPPEIAFELADVFGDFVVPVPQVDMDKTTADEIGRLLTRGARGIKFICPMHSYGDNRYFPLYKVICDCNAMAVFHTGNLSDELHRPGAVLGRDDFVDITDMRPAAIDRVARAFPDMKVVMAHFGNPWWEEAWTVIKAHKNVYADFSGATAKIKSMSMWSDLFAPNGRLHVQSVRKLCFGSDATYFVPNVFGYDSMIEFYDRFYEALAIPDELRLLIDRLNILSLCGCC
jgi:predicted TIM-barrel fold metal-dependent hydrolase